MEELRTFLEIQNGILSRAKLQDNVENRAKVKEYINTYYVRCATEEPYRWSGDTIPIKLRAKYDTGTITVTQGSDIVTGAGTTWVENDHRFSRMQIPGSNQSFKIIRVGSTTSITLDQPWVGDTAAGVSYYIFRDEYGLPPDLHGLRGFRIQGIPTRIQPKPMAIRDIDKLRDRLPFRSGPPLYYTRWGKAVYTEKTWATFNIGTDYWEDSLSSPARNDALVVWPAVMTTDKFCHVRFTKVPYPMELDAEEPIMPVAYRAILVWGPLIEHFLVNRDAPTSREWLNQHKEIKRRMAGDIEETDDELIVTLDKSMYRRSRGFVIDEDELLRT